MFRTWASELQPTIEICPIQLPGREGRLREPPFTRLEPLAVALAAALAPAMDRPFAFFGHSMGALIGFELARHLRAVGRPEPIYLAVSAYGAPQLPRRRQPIHHLSDVAFTEELRRLNGTPTELLEHAELMQLVLPTLRADFALVEEYSYVDEPPLGCPIAAFGGLEDFEAPRESLEPWRKQTSKSCALRMLPGEHFFLNSSQGSICRSLALDLHGIAPIEAG
jgi:medium-chain acyl-[acyl-carrier-protein] hydrolase